MSKQQHTPGPWEVIGQHVFTKLGATNAHGSKAHDRDGWNIATINPWACTNQDGEDEDMPVSETMANARLIASAPELLEAAEFGHADSMGMPAGDLLAAANILRNTGYCDLAAQLEKKHEMEMTAIARARGES